MIEYLASALTCRQTPKSRRAISWAIYDAAKLFTLELELEAGRAFRGLHVGIRRAVMRSPQTATEYLDETVRRLIPKAR
ncbi:MAG: hypothetical protein DME26_06905 [Verrucomicrobia bacterium]|nr:MAG: hypothetical protein DME26_06905 [Verrucomicrobiota bacterium]